MPDFGQHLTPLFSPLAREPSSARAQRPAPPALSIRDMRVFHVAHPPSERVLRIESQDGRHFLVEERIARHLRFIVDSFSERDFRRCNTLVLDFVYADVLAYVLYFCMIKSRVEIGALGVAHAERLVFEFAEKFYLLRDVRMLHLLLEVRFFFGRLNVLVCGFRERC